jgi:hypothetical protein
MNVRYSSFRAEVLAERREGADMEEAGAELKVLRMRMAGIGAQLDAGWAEKLRDHLHLDRDTVECAYWHSGYYQALADVLNLMTNSRSISDTSGISNPRLAVG